MYDSGMHIIRMDPDKTLQEIKRLATLADGLAKRENLAVKAGEPMRADFAGLLYAALRRLRKLAGRLLEDAGKLTGS